MEDKKNGKNWFLVDASDQSLGRMASSVANILRGKNKPNFSYNEDVGDFVVVINLSALDINKDKEVEKKYYRHSGYPGGLKSRTLKEMRKRDICWVFRKSVSGMLPRNKLKKNWLKRLKLYEGTEHKHQAQKLIEVKNGK